MREKAKVAQAIKKHEGVDPLLYKNLLKAAQIVEKLETIIKFAREKQKEEKEEQERQNLLRQKSREDPSLCICGKPGTKKCTGCMATLYCSKKCLKQDYKPHRSRCQELQKEKENAEKS